MNLIFSQVIVGGGLTGLVAANKIASSGATVLVIEAGKNLQNETLINNAFEFVQLNPFFMRFEVDGLCVWQRQRLEPSPWPLRLALPDR